MGSCAFSYIGELFGASIIRKDQNRNVKYPRLTYTNTTNTYTGSDYWLFNGAYFRVKNITLGYSLPQKLMDKCFIRDFGYMQQ